MKLFSPPFNYGTRIPKFEILFLVMISLGLGLEPMLLPPKFSPRVLKGQFLEDANALILEVFSETWVAYNPSQCAMLSVWQGSLDEQMLRDRVFYPQGVEYHRNTEKEIWNLTSVGQNLKITHKHISEEISATKITLIYQLTFGNSVIHIQESPVYDAHYGSPALFRTFEIKGLPTGHKLTLNLSGGLVEEQWSNAGGVLQLKVAGKSSSVEFSRDGTHRIKATWGSGH